MLTKIDMDIPLELLGLSDIKLTVINLRNKRELIIKVESTKETTTCRNCGKDGRINPDEQHKVVDFYLIILWSMLCQSYKFQRDYRLKLF